MQTKLTLDFIKDLKVNSFIYNYFNVFRTLKIQTKISLSKCLREKSQLKDQIR